MKTIELNVEDTFYQQPVAMIEQLPREKAEIKSITSNKIDQELFVEDAVDYVLEKNAELYNTIGQTAVLAVHEELMDKYASAFERLAK
jgi:hypothetical protein